MTTGNFAAVGGSGTYRGRILGMALVVLVLAIAGACSDTESEKVTDGVLQLTDPLDGSTVGTQEVTIRGLALANAEVRRDISWGKDDSFRANGEGVWEYKTKLDQGENQAEFFLEESNDTRLKVKITYDPSLAVAPDSPAPNATTDTSNTPASTPATTPSPLPATPSQPPVTPAPRWITGLTAVDVTGNLENRGLNCTGPTQLQTLVAWDCSESTSTLEYQVSVMGQGATRIRSISATVLNYSGSGDDQAAGEFLGYLASVPYDDGNPGQAQQWVKANIASGGDLVIGSARFSMYGPATARSLEIVAVGAN